MAMAQLKIQDSWAQTDVLDCLGDCMVGFPMTWGNLSCRIFKGPGGCSRGGGVPGET